MENDLVQRLSNDDEFLRLLVLEQYRQAAEEYRAEDRLTWQTFATVIAINGVLVALLNLGSASGFSVPLVLSGVVGVVSVLAGIRIIGRNRLYQKQRLITASQIEDFAPFTLYLRSPIEDYMRQSGVKIEWDERGSGRKTIQVMLFVIGLMWITVMSIAFYTVLS